MDGAAPSDLVLRTGLDGPNDPSEPSYIAGRLQGVWHSTVSGSNTGSIRLRLLLPIALVIVVTVVLRRRRDTGMVPEAAVLGLVVLMALAMVAHPAALIPGFLPAAPVLVLGVVAALVEGVARPTWLVLLTAVLYTAALFLTQYPDGGNFQWGGRFLTPLVVPLAAVAAIGVAAIVERRPAGRRRPFAASSRGARARVVGRWGRRGRVLAGTRWIASTRRSSTPPPRSTSRRRTCSLGSSGVRTCRGCGHGRRSSTACSTTSEPPA